MCSQYNRREVNLARSSDGTSGLPQILLHRGDGAERRLAIERNLSAGEIRKDSLPHVELTENACIGHPELKGLACAVVLRCDNSAAVVDICDEA